ncbi:MAG: hypothetical protein ACRENB_13685 [Gemmatimonadales bacterium]
MVHLADMPFWLVMIIVFSVVGPMMRFASREGRYWGRHAGRRVLADQEVARMEAALAERDQVIEDLQRRIGEMEERLDFTERLLASRSQERLTVDG